MSRKKLLVTGAASGIGKAAAIRFAAEGYDVCLNDLDASKLQVVRESLEKGDHLILAGSYAEPETLARGAALIAERWGALDVLVNCAGLFERSDPISTDMEQWRRVMDIMLSGCVGMTRLAVNAMPQGGRIVHISSIHDNRAEHGSSSYAVAKAGIDQFCRAMALELADRKILVNAIAPGFVDTPMSVVDGKNELETDWFRDNYVKSQRIPLRRAADPEEIASVAFFLAGKDASYITGQVITVDGGLTITF
jgi:3-oxoacyl-[acyl-carrier protein] reductase